MRDQTGRCAPRTAWYAGKWLNAEEEHVKTHLSIQSVMQNTLSIGGTPFSSNMKQTAVGTLIDTGFIMVVLPHVLTSIMSCTFQFIWEIYSWADELKQQSGVFLAHGFRVFALWPRFLKWMNFHQAIPGSGKKKICLWLATHFSGSSQEDTASTEQAIFWASVLRHFCQHSFTFTSIHCAGKVLQLLVFYGLASRLENSVYTEFAAFSVFLQERQRSSGIPEQYYTYAQWGLATRMTTLNYCYLVQQSLSSTCWQLMEG